MRACSLPDPRALPPPNPPTLQPYVHTVHPLQCCARSRCVLLEPQPWRCYRSARKRLKGLGVPPLPAFAGAVTIEGTDPESTVDRMVQARGLTGGFALPLCLVHANAVVHDRNPAPWLPQPEAVVRSPWSVYFHPSRGWHRRVCVCGSEPGLGVNRMGSGPAAVLAPGSRTASARGRPTVVMNPCQCATHARSALKWKSHSSNAIADTQGPSLFLRARLRVGQPAGGRHIQLEVLTRRSRFMDSARGRRGRPTRSHLKHKFNLNLKFKMMNLKSNSSSS
jgi:hypothetical protein